MNYRNRRCPYCGRTTGLYITGTYKDVVSYYDFNGNWDGESLDGATFEGGKKMYCQTCDKYICNIKDYEKLFPMEETK